jgi:hypothetical protein
MDLGISSMKNKKSNCSKAQGQGTRIQRPEPLRDFTAKRPGHERGRIADTGANRVSPALTPLVTTSAPPVQLNNRDWESVLRLWQYAICILSTPLFHHKSHRRLPLAPSPDSAHRGVSGVHASSTTLPGTSVVPSTPCRVLYEQNWLLPHTSSNGKNLLYRDKYIFFTPCTIDIRLTCPLSLWM